jgi:hypothetical protein
MAKLAVQARVASILIWAVDPLPEQSPLQPANVEPALGAADSATVEPAGKLAVQVAPQSIPGGAEVTLPAPSPAEATTESE